MARNSEKAVTALARWRNMQLKEQGKLFVERRPNNPNNEHDAKRAEKWRMHVIKEIAKKVTQIQNAGLGEFKIRDLNDEINRLLKEKYAWEDRIHQLGGPDYKKVGARLLDREGQEVPGNRGYKYFGAAKELPGVKELFEQEALNDPKKSRAELMKEIDAEYYGYIDDEDHLLLEQEAKCEREGRQRLIDEFNARVARGEVKADDEVATAEDKQTTEPDEFVDSDEDERGMYDHYYDSKGTKFKKLNLEVPTLKQVEEAILEQKKRELLKKYLTDEFMESAEETNGK